jgi:poly-gamma-glutamate synthesis protein (capsule biosynthesis protein)
MAEMLTKSDDLGVLMSFTSRPTVGPKVRLAAVGDVSASGRVAQHLSGTECGSAGGAFRDIRASDLAFANFECVVDGGGPARPFSIPETSVAELRNAGFNVVNLANNHVLDRGPAGVDETLQAVEATGMTAIGIAKGGREVPSPVRTDRNGLRIGWLAAARTLIAQSPPGHRVLELDAAVLDIAVRRARAELDVLIVSLHAGYMMVEYPAPGLRDLARGLAAAGADLILMHHPHVLQGVEVTAEGRVICYSLGNFLFDWREGEISVPIVEDLQRQGGIFAFELDRKGVASAAFRPTLLDDECQAVLPSPSLATEICERVARLSGELHDDYIPRFELQRAERNTALGVKTLLRLLRTGQFGTFFRSLGRARPYHLVMGWRWLMGARS